MPLGKHFGYIFTDNTDEASLNRTIAHELGHGAFALYHPFDEYDPPLKPGDTENLMDYSDGTRLRKYQWDLIHDPVFVAGGGSDEEASVIATVKKTTIKFPNTIIGNRFDENSTSECQHYPTYSTINIGGAIESVKYLYAEGLETINNIKVIVKPKKTTDTLRIIRAQVKYQGG
jgi:hypothetical protein